MKTCFKCNKPKPIDKFYRHPKMGDGHLGKCKECTRADVKLNRRNRIHHYAEYERQRFQTPKRKEQATQYAKEHNKRHPEKARARSMVSNFLKQGKLQKAPCEVCGNPKSQAHHENYSKPLEVKWLCFQHHREAHGQTVL